MPYRNQHNCIIDSTITESLEVVEVDTKWGKLKVVKGMKGGKLVPRSIRFPSEVPVQVAQSLCRTRGGKFEPATPINPQKQLLSEEDQKGMLDCLLNLRLVCLEVEMSDWSSVYKNDLPDSSFVVILSGGKKDGTGRTVPRSLRLLPYKDKNGVVSKGHVQNALVRVNQIGASSSVKREALVKLLRIARGLGVEVQKEGRFNLSDLHLRALENLEGI